MRGYYTTFNMETKKIGFAPTSDSLKKIIESGETPTRTRDLDLGIVIGVSSSSAILLGLIIFLFIQYICYMMAASSRKAKATQQSAADTNALLNQLQNLLA